MKAINPRTLTSHTNAHDICGRPTLKDVQRDFRNGPVHESLSNDSKVLISSHEIANSNDPNITDNYNTIHETTTTDMKTDCMHAEMKKSDPREFKNLKKPTSYREGQPA